MPDKFLSANIFRSDYDSSLNKFHGVQRISYPTPEGIYDKPDHPAVKFVVRKLYNCQTQKKDGSIVDGYVHAEPANKEPGEWYAFGGTFIYCSDSRFPFKYPVPVHDRCMNLE